MISSPGGVEVTEPALGLEGRERTDQLGLVVGVAVHPRRRIERNAAVVLAVEADAGLLE